MKRNLTKLALSALVLLLAAVLFSSCNMGLPWDIEVWGVWEGDNTLYGSDEKTVITIKNDTISVDMPAAWTSDYSGEVVSFDNDSYNIAADNPTSGNYGHLIFKITSHENDASWAQAQIGKFSVIRWTDLTETGLSYMESGVQFDTAEEAAAAEGSNFFGSSALTKAE